MTIASETNRNDYLGDDTTDEFPYSFRIFSDSDLRVTERDEDGVESLLVLDTDYTVDGAGDLSGGSITLLSGDLADDHTLTIRRVLPITQETDIRNQGDFFPEAHEDEFDRLTMVDQQQQDEIDRSIKMPETISSDDFDLDLPTDIAGAESQVLITNATGDGFEMGPTSDEISNAQAYSESAAASALSALQYANALSVVSYGAVGNGSTDDTAAFQSALTQAGVLGGAVVLVPRGTYKITSQLTWPDASNVWLRGEGVGASIIKFAWGGSPSTTSIGILVDAASSLSNVRISDMTLQGLANDDTAIFELVEVQDGVSDCRFENLELKWARQAGLRFSSGSAGERVWIRNCYFHDLNSSAMTGIAGGAVLGAFDKFHLLGNTFKDVGNAGTFHAFYPTGRSDIVLANNIFSGTHARAHFFGVTYTRVSILNNTFKTGGAVVQGIVNGVFSGNTLYDAPLSLVSDGLIVNGNTFRFTAGSSNPMITCGTACSRVVITNNIFDDQSGGSNNVAITISNVAADQWTIAGNSIFASTYGIWVYGTNHVIKENRVYTTSTGEIIYLRGGTGHSVVNNVLQTGSTGRAVWNESGAVQVIRGNILLGGAKEGGVSGGITTVGQPHATTGTRAITTSYTLTANDSVILADATGGAITVTLPAASGGTAGVGRFKEYTVKRMNSGANAVVVTRAGSDTLDGATTKTLGSQYAAIQFVADPDAASWNLTALMGTVT